MVLEKMAFFVIAFFAGLMVLGTFGAVRSNQAIAPREYVCRDQEVHPPN